MPSISENRGDIRFTNVSTAPGTQRLGMPPKGPPNAFSTVNRTIVNKRTSSIDARSVYTTTANPIKAGVGAYKFNMTGRSIWGGGGLGRSNSPASHSGFDPDMPRGLSSQLNFDMVASEQ